MRITSKGQVTIPIDIREKAGLLPNTEVMFEFDGTSVRIFQAPPSGKESRGGLLLRRLRGSATVQMTTDEIMAVTRGR
ncbi:MAG: AbrB/MazE/SpoVT family DNA-binding domain-containing protein [Holophaga sp.]|nr:AbrB/MazE/SpoVT family DNA-binding domain-containing protein [Holophaga sp.]